MAHRLLSTGQSMPTPHEVATEVRRELTKGGVRAALVRLNEYSAHRFTALFRFHGSTLQNLHLVDHLNADVERCPDMPVEESYCVFVRDLASRFMTENADTDGRVTGHPKQELIKSYCGLPLQTSTGELFGTICHFDYAALPFAENEILVLEDIARHLVATVEAGDPTVS
jgi:GAF domain-containing protein